MDKVNYLDIIILLPIIYGLVRGLMRGFVVECTAIIAIFLGIVAAKLWAPPFAVKILQVLEMPEGLAQSLAYVLLFVGVTLFCKAIARLVNRLLKAISLNPSLLQTYGASDRLLFSAADYLDLSKSNTFTALQGLMADEEARTLLAMFLLASAKKNLSMCSFRLFDVQKPKDEEVWSTEVTKEDLKNAVEDEFGVKYSKDWKRLLRKPKSLRGKYSIRKGVKVIGNGAFFWCEYLTSINIPNSVTTIGNGAFSRCSSLISINIPNSVTTIGRGAFIQCI